MSEEPGYLQAIKRAREAKQQKGASASAATGRPTLSAQEREATRWAGEVAKTEIRSTANLSGARFAVLLKLAGASGAASFALEGFTSKELLVGRIKKAGAMQEEVAGAYEVNNGRPLTVKVEGEEVTFAAGTPRPGAKPLTPEQMLRQAQKEAEIRAKTRPAFDKNDRGQGGRR